MDTDLNLSLLANETFKWPHWESTGELTQCQAFAASEIAITEVKDTVHHSLYEWCLGISFQFSRHAFVLSFGLSETHQHAGEPLLEMSLSVDRVLVSTVLFRRENKGTLALVSLQALTPGDWEASLQKIGEQIQIAKVCHAQGHWPRWAAIKAQ